MIHSEAAHSPSYTAYILKECAFNRARLLFGETRGGGGGGGGGGMDGIFAAPEILFLGFQSLKERSGPGKGCRNRGGSHMALSVSVALFRSPRSPEAAIKSLRTY